MIDVRTYTHIQARVSFVYLHNIGICHEIRFALIFREY